MNRFIAAVWKRRSPARWVACALGWACWKTYLGRPETEQAQRMAMNQLGNGLSDAKHHADALSVKEAQLSTARRLGVPQGHMLVMQSNLAVTYEALGRLEQALRTKQNVYSGYVKLLGKEDVKTLMVAAKYALALVNEQRFEEAKSLLREQIPVARRVLGENDLFTLTMRGTYAEALYLDTSTTLGDLRGAVAMLEEIERIARRAFGTSHPTVVKCGLALRNARGTLRAREILQSSIRIPNGQRTNETSKNSNLHVQQHPHLFRRMH